MKTTRRLVISLLASAACLATLTSPALSQVPARLFTTGGNAIIDISNSGPVQWCVQAEPINNDFQVTDININTVVLISNGTGSVSQIPAITRNVLVSDADGNGIQDVRLCFTKADLQNLFSNFHGHKQHTVNLTVTGNLFTGGSFSGQITMTVQP